MYSIDYNQSKKTARTSLCFTPLLHIKEACASTSLCTCTTRFCHPAASFTLARLGAAGRKKKESGTDRGPKPMM